MNNLMVDMKNKTTATFLFNFNLHITKMYKKNNILSKK